METAVCEMFFIMGFVMIFLLLNKQNRVNGQICTFSGVMAAVLLYYFAVPALVLYYRHKAAQSGGMFLSLIAEAEPFDIMLACLRVQVFVLFYYLTYRVFNNSKMKNFYVLSEHKFVKICRFLVMFTFLIGWGSFLVYIRAFGSINNLLFYADYLRSFSNNAASVIPYFASIMIIPARLITVTPILILTVINHEKRVAYLLMYKFIFVVSLIGAIMFSLVNAGKTLIITYFLFFTVPIMRKFVKRPWRLIVIFGLFLVPLIGYLDALFQFFQKGEFIVKQFSIMNYLGQFAHPYTNVLNVFGIINQSGLRFCRDFVTGVLNIIPGVNFQPSYEVTSYFYGGDLWKQIGGIPNDIITFGYIEMGLVGMVFVAVLLGIITGKIDRLFDSMGNKFAFNILKTTVIINFFCLVVNADIISIVRNQFLLTIPCVCLLYASKRTA